MSIQYIIASLPGKRIRANIGGEGKALFDVSTQIGGLARIQLLKEPYEIKFTQDNPDVRAYLHASQMRKVANFFPEIAHTPQIMKGHLGDLLDQSVLFNIYKLGETTAPEQLKFTEARGFLMSWPGAFDIGKNKVLPGVFIKDFAVFPQAGDNRIVLQKLLFEYAEAAAKAMKAKVLYLTAETSVNDKFLKGIGFSDGVALKKTLGHSLYTKMLSLGALALLAWVGFGNQNKGASNA